MKKSTKTVSWRTLMRRAEATKDKAESKKLRAKAARMRRDERATEKPAPKNVAKKRKPVVADALAPSAEAQVVKVVRHDWDVAGGRVSTAIESRRPGGGDMAAFSADPLAIKARAVLVEARKKKGAEGAVRDLLVEVANQARLDGQNLINKMAASEMASIREAHREILIEGFIAQTKDALSSGRGLSDVVHLPAHLVMALYEHLKQ